MESNATKEVVRPRQAGLKPFLISRGPTVGALGCLHSSFVPNVVRHSADGEDSQSLGPGRGLTSACSWRA